MTNCSLGLSYYEVIQCQFQWSGRSGNWLPFMFPLPALSVGKYLDLLASCFSVDSTSNPQGFTLLLLLSFMRTISHTCAVEVADTLFLCVFSRSLPKTILQGWLVALGMALLPPVFLAVGPISGQRLNMPDSCFSSFHSGWGDHMTLFWPIIDKESLLGGI